jgi:hypothetical protein
MHMKKVFLIAGVLMSLGLSFASCKQEHVCSCDKTYITGDSTGATINNYSLYPYTDSRRRAENRCKENNTTDMNESGAYNITCKLK